jgi:hypothetical protein
MSFTDHVLVDVNVVGKWFGKENVVFGGLVKCVIVYDELMDLLIS